MSVNAARRGRRGSPATAPADDVAAADPVAAGDERPAGSSGRRRGGANARLVAFPEPTPSAYTTAPPLPPLAAVPRGEAPSAPAVPTEQPAVLHPTDRRSFAPAAPVRAPYRSSSIEQLAIGEIDQTLFDCPACRRPLALGTRRCPGCGSHLVRSVLVRKAALFVAVGALVGGLAGLGGGVVLGGGLAAGAAPLAAGPSGSGQPGSSGSAAASPSAGTPTAEPTTAPIQSQPPAGGLPFAVRSSFTQMLVLDTKLAAAEADLRAELKARPFDASAVAATLRSVSAQSLFGSGLAAQVAGWSGAGELGSRLTAYYGTLHDTAVAALDNSVRNTKAYQSAAGTMAGLLAGRAAIEDAIRAAAQAAGEALP